MLSLLPSPSRLIMTPPAFSDAPDVRRQKSTMFTVGNQGRKAGKPGAEARKNQD
jgi:hypothetical protein